MQSIKFIHGVPNFKMFNKFHFKSFLHITKFCNQQNSAMQNADYVWMKYSTTFFFNWGYDLKMDVLNILFSQVKRLL